MGRTATVACFTTAVTVSIVVMASTTLAAQLSRASTKVSHSTTVPSNSKTTIPTTPNGLITIGPSRSECVVPDMNHTGYTSLETALTRFDNKTRSVVTCVSTYLNGAMRWSQWVNPWVTKKRYGYTTWVAGDPQSRQLVLGVNLIPSSLANLQNPLSWEQSCSAGAFDSYATQLGTNLVHAGLQNSVIRLGPEMNGRWEDDYIGNTTREQNLWASCFANEVTALRQATGEHFLIDWNVNACVENIPYAHFYPGNSYVDVLGLDLFDESCIAPKASYTFQQLADEPASLKEFEAFAVAKRKPMSLPEWGFLHGPAKDHPGYFNGIGSTFTKGDFAFETYFDFQTPHPLLGSRTPLSLAAFQKWFGVAVSKSEQRRPTVVPGLSESASSPP